MGLAPLLRRLHQEGRSAHQPCGPTDTSVGHSVGSKPNEHTREAWAARERPPQTEGESLRPEDAAQGEKQRPPGREHTPCPARLCPAWPWATLGHMWTQPRCPDLPSAAEPGSRPTRPPLSYQERPVARDLPPGTHVHTSPQRGTIRGPQWASQGQPAGRGGGASGGTGGGDGGQGGGPGGSQPLPWVLDPRGEGAGGHTFSAALPEQPKRCVSSQDTNTRAPGHFLHRDRSPDR